MQKREIIMKRKKRLCLLLSVLLLCTGCGGKGNEAGNLAEPKSSSNGGNTSDGSVMGVVAAGELYDIELTEETLVAPLQEGELFLGAQYFGGERIWFIGNNDGQVFCYYEERNTRELLLENVPAEYRLGNTWYRDEAYFYVYGNNVLAVLRLDGEEAYALELDGRVINVCISKEGKIVLVKDDSGTGDSVQILDRENGTLSGKYPLFDYYAMAVGIEKGVLIMDHDGVYDLDVENGEKIWHVKWNGTSYIPNMTGWLCTFRMSEDGTLEQLVETEEGFRTESLRKVNIEEIGKILLVFRVLHADQGLKLLVAKFNKENQEYHVILQDRGEEYGWDFCERNDMEIATGKGPDLLAEDAVSDICGLAAKGALENLEPYFVRDKIGREAYVASAFQNFGREDGIYGMGYEMRTNTMYMKEELAGDSLEVLLDNLENYDKQVVFCSSFYYTPNKLLGYFFRMSDDFYGMVDWEEKTCSFSGELWETILRVVKQYGVTDRNQQWEEIAMPAFGGGIWSFAEDDANAMQDGMILAGYPTEEGMKHWLSVHGVSINTASEHKEGAWQFIKFLLNEENQKLVERNSYLPVCEKALQECVAAWEEQRYYNAAILPEEMEGWKKQLFARFWECLDNAEPAPWRTEDILEIIQEEAELYFTGDKTIEEISSIIENRVRLYLAELE